MFDIDVDSMSIEDMQKIIKSQIKRGKGLISYRKHLVLLKKLHERLDMLTVYRKELVKEIDDDMAKINASIVGLREKIQEAMESDDSIQMTESGGKTIKLPDVATVSLSKEKETIVITDPKSVMEQLGDDYIKITKSLNVPKAKIYIKDADADVDGVSVVTDRTLTIKFK